MSPPRFSSAAWLWEVPAAGRPRSFWRRLSPPQLFVASFALMVLLGTLGLKLLPGLYTGKPLSWLDALFTATSAVCITGLTVVDTATHFTPAGQAYLLLLVQVGGLGMITFMSLVIVAVGGRLSLRQEVLSGGTPLDAPRQVSPRRLVLDVVRFTLAFELAGAVLLYLLWVPRFGWSGAAWPAVFQSVSAFCNAGFSTFSDSMVSFRGSPASLFVIMALVVSGGLGFLSLEELYLRGKAWRAGRSFRLSLQTRIVLTTTVLLLAGGWLLYAWLEWDAALAGMTDGDKAVNALFMSVSCRSSGFTTVDYSRATEAGNFLTVILMAIGASPGGTGGGMKTTTFALLALLAWSRYRGDEVASVAGRSLRKETTDRAVGLFVVAFGLLTAGILALTVTERAATAGGFLDWMFEASSAFNTVGLSTGITPALTPAGRAVVIGMMFLGRVGPLVLFAALALRPQGGGRFRYAYEDVTVG
jgi:trk system potassium uptake protein TrkH